MTEGRLSRQSEFPPVPSHGSIFVYMVPPQNAMLARVTPVVVPSHNREFKIRRLRTTNYGWTSVVVCL